MVAFPDFQLLDVAGPLEVFGRTARWLVEQGHRTDLAYTTEVVASSAGPLASSSGIRLVAERAYAEAPTGIDTLMIAGGRGARRASTDESLVAWLRRTAPRVRRVASVCTGTFILGAAGLLDGRRATTHWESCEALARLHPQITVDPSPIFTRDGHIYTSAGVTAGMDLALAMVEDDLGRDVALQVARRLVMFLRRPGGQSQFSVHLSVQQADRQPLRDLQGWIADHLSEDLSIGALAERVAMSPRHFARVFTEAVGVTPARYVELLRVEAARRRLEESSDSVEGIAAMCGFGTAESMRRAFLKIIKVSPAAYRGRFSNRSDRALDASIRRTWSLGAASAGGER
jgi:transcriptional regulator GlxA family with amidase domain